jgi:hypothetical protein
MHWARRGALRRTEDRLLAEDAAEQAVQQLLAVAARGRIPLDIKAWLARVAEHQVGRLARRPEWKLRARSGDELLAKVPAGREESSAERLLANRRQRRDRARKQRLPAALKKLAATEKKLSTSSSCRDSAATQPQLSWRSTDPTSGGSSSVRPRS